MQYFMIIGQYNKKLCMGERRIGPLVLRSPKKPNINRVQKRIKRVQYLSKYSD